MKSKCPYCLKMIEVFKFCNGSKLLVYGIHLREGKMCPGSHAFAEIKLA